MYITSKNDIKVGMLKMNTIISKIDINNIDKNGYFDLYWKWNMDWEQMH